MILLYMLRTNAAIITRFRNVYDACSSSAYIFFPNGVVITHFDNIRAAAGQTARMTTTRRRNAVLVGGHFGLLCINMPCSC